MVKRKNGRVSCQIKKLEKEKEALEGGIKRALADYHNLEKRYERQRQDLTTFLNAQLLDKILPALDDLELCRKHIKEKSLAMVLSKFRQVLKSEGVEEIKALGEEFDPEKMDAIEVVAGPKNKVMEVVLRGYLLNNKVLRPAKVKVGQG